MADSLLDQIHSQIRDRARELRPAVFESERLTAALAALDSLGAAPPAKRQASPARVGKPRLRPSRPSPSRPSSPKRAPRGANRAAVLGVLAERPGVSVTELSTAADIARPVLYALLKTLEERGEVVKEELPGGITGYRLASGASPQAATPAASGTSR
jgi:hypothetical protein